MLSVSLTVDFPFSLLKTSLIIPRKLLDLTQNYKKSNIQPSSQENLSRQCVNKVNILVLFCLHTKEK